MEFPWRVHVDQPAAAPAVAAVAAAVPFNGEQPGQFFNERAPSLFSASMIYLSLAFGRVVYWRATSYLNEASS